MCVRDMYANFSSFMKKALLLDSSKVTKCLSFQSLSTFRKHVRILQSLLKNCEVCECVAYCSSKCSAEDAEEHEKSCSLLKIALMDYIYSRNNKACLSRKWRPRAKLMRYDVWFSISLQYKRSKNSSRIISLLSVETCQLPSKFSLKKRWNWHLIARPIRRPVKWGNWALNILVN